MADNKRLIETLFGILNDALENVHTATIARVEVVNDTTLDLQPVIGRQVRGETRDRAPMKNVPVVTLQGGTSYSAPPIVAGDYVFVVMGERCFDRWWDGQDGRPPLENRMHDYSDAIAIAGLKPKTGAVPIPDIWTEIGDRYQEGNWELVGNYTQEGDYTQTGDQTQEGDREQTGNETIIGDLNVQGNVTVTGNLTVQGTIAAGAFAGLSGGPMTSDVNFETTADVQGSGVSLATHTHPGDSGGNTGPPN